MNHHKILLVDDEINILSSLKRLLRKEEYEIVTASSGREGLEILTKHKVSLIISDQRMPEMSGVEFLRQVKDLYPDTIRIILSGYTDVNTIMASINEGEVYKFITKPWNEEEIRIAIRRSLEQHDLIRENKELYHKIKEQNDELQILNKSLEQKVEKRTRDLLIRNQTLLLSQEILNNLPIAVVGIGENGCIAMVNEMVIEIFGSKIKSPVGLGIDGVFTKEITDMINTTFSSWESQRMDNYHYNDLRLNVKCHPLNSRTNAKGVILIAYKE